MRTPLLALLAILLSGCVAVPAVERRANSASQASWAREKCSDAFGANGRLTPEAVRSVVDMLKTGNSVQCDGRAIDFDVLVALEEGKKMGSPNPLLWVGAYIADRLITLISVPAVAGLAAVGAGDVATVYTGQNAYGPGTDLDQYGRPYSWQPAQGHGGGVLGPVKPDAYGPGVGMDSTGKPVKRAPAY